MNNKKLEKEIGYTFKDTSYLELALTHKSYTNENSEAASNERIEFLGDAVLQFLITDYIYRKYKEESEGLMSAYRAAVVNTETLFNIGKKIGILTDIKTSKGQTKDINDPSVKGLVADAIESLIGAIFLDGGLEEANKFIEKTIIPEIEEKVKDDSWKDAKSTLQEKSQDILKVTPRYEIKSETGPDHDRTFVVSVYLGEEEIAEAEGKSKQNAEQGAAEIALKVKKWS